MTFRRPFKRIVISGGLLACSVLIWAGEVLAQASLPLDTDFTSSESDTELPATESSPQPADSTAEDASTENLEGSSSPSPEELDVPATAAPLQVSPVEPPTPLKPNEIPIEETSNVTDTPAAADDLPDLSEPPPEMSTEEGPNQDVPAADLPVQELESFLVGQDAETAVSMLERDGWIVIAQTPRLIQLDRGQLGLDLNIDGTTGKVVEAVLVDLT